MTPPARLTVLISGNGSNLQAVIDSISSSALPAQIIRVISNRKNAFGLERARRADIPTHYHNLVKYKKQHADTPDGVQAAREEYDAELARLVLQDAPDLVVCLGFMHVVSDRFLGPLEEKRLGIVNLHPALPGRFNGTVGLSCVVYRFLWTDDADDGLECYPARPRGVARRANRQNRGHDPSRHLGGRHGRADSGARDPVCEGRG